MTSQSVRACRVAAGIFGLIFVLHAWRLITKTDVTVGAWPAPMSVSWVALVISGGLAWWMWRSSSRN